MIIRINDQDDPALLDDLKRAAAADRRPVSVFVARILRAFLEVKQ